MADSNRRCNLSIFLYGFAGSSAAILLFVVLITVFFLKFSFLNGSSCWNGSYFHFCFIDERWDSETYLSIISSFYGTIIGFLTLILGAVVGLAYVVIRGAATESAKDAIREKVEDFFESVKFQELVEESLNDATIGNIKMDISKIREVFNDNEIDMTAWPEDTLGGSGE